MTKKRRFLFVWTLLGSLGLAWSGCSSGPATSDRGGPLDGGAREQGPVDAAPPADSRSWSALERACLTHVQPICTWLDRCCSGSDRENPFLQLILAARGVSCPEAAASPAYTACLPRLSDSLAAGRSRLDEEELGRCERALQDLATSCRPVGRLLKEIWTVMEASCQGMVVGQVPAGAACHSSEFEYLEDCAAGHYCSFDKRRAAPGVCTPIIPAGDPCDWNDACGVGNWCIPVTGGAVCGKNPGEGEPCDDQLECAPGLFCSTVEGKCRPLLAAGAACEMLDLGCEGLCVYGACQTLCAPP